MKVSSVSVMRVSGDTWTGAKLNMGVTKDTLSFNSRSGVVVNPDERGPREPLPIRAVTVFDRRGQALIQTQSDDLARRIDISRIDYGPHIVLFTDEESFWIAKRFVK